jgi:monofunctional chorismate mutase
MADLSEIRKKIDEIDEQILKLFLERMKCSAQVAQIKKESGEAVLNAAREREILEKVRDASGDESEYSVELFSTILELSRRKQNSIIDGDPDEAVIWQLLQNYRQNNCNIILIGMPGSGKTTVGRILSEKTGRQLIETDDIIREDAGMDIPSIFQDEGEEGFREREQKAVQKAAQLRGVIIATGGGVVTRAANYPPLQRSGIIYHIERDTSLLETEGRPLSQDADLGQMYLERRPMYLAFRDRTVDNSGTPEDTAMQIWGDFIETAKKRRS